MHIILTHLMHIILTHLIHTDQELARQRAREGERGREKGVKTQQDASS